MGLCRVAWRGRTVHRGALGVVRDIQYVCGKQGSVSRWCVLLGRSLVRQKRLEVLAVWNSGCTKALPVRGHRSSLGEESTHTQTTKEGERPLVTVTGTSGPKQ